MIKDNLNNINNLASKGEPFLLIIDYSVSKIVIVPLESAAKEGIFFNIKGFKNYSDPKHANRIKSCEFKLHPITYKHYLKAFNIVYDNLMQGNSYLTNLTFPTRIETNLSLQEIFAEVNAPYKILYKDKFVCFSPEPFISIENNIISSFPMKGTIDADIHDAENLLLNDHKEIAEHNTIVDLIRNDLNMISENVRVEKFRYIDHIKTNRKNLLQVSSVISGDLEENWPSRLGDMLLKILPAGSVTGAPKEKTLEIINSAEQYDRGWYTGVFGVFDGKNFHSAVTIRYIELSGNQLFFKSGGGITVNSSPEKEYNELISKVYVPVD